MTGRIVRLDVGGVQYSTTIDTIVRDRQSLLALYFLDNVERDTEEVTIRASNRNPIADFIHITGKDEYFIDRDGYLFKYVLDYLRCGKLVLPDYFNETLRLREEAKFYKLSEMSKLMRAGSNAQDHQSKKDKFSPSTLAIQAYENAGAGFITVGYRGTFAFGRDGQADVKFRKLSRILVCGRIGLCREVFGDTLNDSRDPDRGGEERYTSRLYLKHSSLEQAFDTLGAMGFYLVASSGTGASGGATIDSSRSASSVVDTEEQKWCHYNQFVFHKPPK